jgi:hypothetical protein
MSERLLRQEMKLPVLSAMKAIWLLLATSVYFLTLSLYDGTATTSDSELILVYGMIVLSFPTSLLILLTVGLFGLLAVAAGAEFSIPTNYLVLTIEWIIFLGCGYMQWFVLLPRAWRRWKTRSGAISTP